MDKIMWRLLEAGENLKPGDESFIDGKWVIQEQTVGCIATLYGCPIRRRVIELPCLLHKPKRICVVLSEGFCGSKPCNLSTTQQIS